MIFELEIDKTPFCSIGPYMFNYDEPKHDIPVDEIDETLKKQFLYNFRKGILKSSAPDVVSRLADVSIVSQDPALTVAVPIREIDVTNSMEDLIDENRKALKKILLGTIPSVKKEAATMRLGNLRKLTELEKEGRNRKKLISFFIQRLEVHTAQVNDSKGTEDLIPKDMILTSMLSTQLTDVVVSEEEEIIIPQEVLNQLNKSGE